MELNWPRSTTEKHYILPSLEPYFLVMSPKMLRTLYITTNFMMTKVLHLNELTQTYMNIKSTSKYHQYYREGAWLEVYRVTDIKTDIKEKFDGTHGEKGPNDTWWEQAWHMIRGIFWSKFRSQKHMERGIFGLSNLGKEKFTETLIETIIHSAVAHV